ncbi:hypothetical protein BWQ96_02035 [Gracilariopsis chorda]|uniref:Uncharacterized protein n=1 Tax=Gracilariopsis chorda TaxID=448386 RepID=A0A2V3J197_9FLOR|nr:hypothetical protein BWQ96_02035 [Gracilariopsis chorda]|eukprot:PXF48083.1 hypothetical protein BWQ96_02035 [Gracilariopsis chorda]
MADKQIQRVLFPSPQTAGLKTSRRTILGPKEELRPLPQRPTPSPGTKRRRSIVALTSIPLRKICDSSPVPLPIAAAAAVASANANSDKILDSVADPTGVETGMKSPAGRLREANTEGMGKSEERPSTPLQQKRVTFSDAVIIREGYPELPEQNQSKPCAESQTNSGVECADESSPGRAEKGSDPHKMEENAATLARHASPVSPAHENERPTSAVHSYLNEETDALRQDCEDSGFANDGHGDSGRFQSHQGGYSRIPSTTEQEKEQDFAEITPTCSHVNDTGAIPELPIQPGDNNSGYREAESTDFMDKTSKQESSEEGMDGAKSRLRKRGIEKRENEDCYHGTAHVKKRPRLSEVLRLQKSLETAFWTDSRKVRNLREPVVISEDDEPPVSRETRTATPGRKKSPMRRPNTERRLQTQPTRSTQKKKKKSSVLKHTGSPNQAMRERNANDRTGPLTRSRSLNAEQSPIFADARDKRQRASQRAAGNTLKRSVEAHGRNRKLTRPSRERNEAARHHGVSPVSSESRQSVLVTSEDVIMQGPVNQEEMRTVVIRKRTKRKSSSPKQFRSTPCFEHVRQLPDEEEVKSADKGPTTLQLATIARTGHGAEVTNSMENCSPDKDKKSAVDSDARDAKERSDSNRVMETDLEVMDFVKLSAKEWANFQIGWDLHMEITSTSTQIDLSKVFEYIQSPFGFGNSFVLVL